MNENERKSYIKEIFKMVCPKTEGTQRAILIGVDYYGKRTDRIIGCAYDAIRMKDSLKAKDIKLMVDVFGSRFVRNNV
jgi:hypothetical protein